MGIHHFALGHNQSPYYSTSFSVTFPSQSGTLAAELLSATPIERLFRQQDALLDVIRQLPSPFSDARELSFGQAHPSIGRYLDERLLIDDSVRTLIDNASDQRVFTLAPFDYYFLQMRKRSIGDSEPLSRCILTLRTPHDYREWMREKGKSDLMVRPLDASRPLIIEKRHALDYSLLFGF